jgi:hypothetical protein
MIQFSSNLMKEVDQSLRIINAKNIDTLKKAGEVTIILKDAFERLRTFVCEYQFKDEEEEMLFFKQIKPSLLCDLIYYRKVYNIELNRPTGGDAEVKCYLEKELSRIKDFLIRTMLSIVTTVQAKQVMTECTFFEDSSIVRFIRKVFLLSVTPCFLPAAIIRLLRYWLIIEWKTIFWTNWQR